MIQSIQSIAEKAVNLLSGEPLRFISYGAVIVTYLILKAAVALGYQVDAPNFDGIAIAVTASITVVTEFVRRFVSSPKTVSGIVDEYEDELAVLLAMLRQAQRDRDAIAAEAKLSK